MSKNASFVMVAMIGCGASVTIMNTITDNRLMDILYPEE